MFCKIISADLSGIEATQVNVEVDVAGGLPGFTVVGLPGSEIREARERVERAIINVGMEFPPRRITVNLSPANVRKTTSGLDLPIAIGILTATGSIDEAAVRDYLFTGELSLDGEINSINGALPMAILARDMGLKGIILPEDNIMEGAVVDGIRVYGASHLKTLIADLKKGTLTDTEHIDVDEALRNAYSSMALDYADVNGQEKAKRATMIAVAGFHNLMYVGPPGSGKSMMARRIPTILNRMTKEECLEVSVIYSVSGLLGDMPLVLSRPFRSPHQSITRQALIGGSSNPRPGEISLAHKGILFLDEFAEYQRQVIEDLRIPLENGEIVVTRVAGQAVFPCDFMLVAAANPCRCGYYPDRRFCRCSESEVEKYAGRIRGPILDRIDICVGVTKVKVRDLAGEEGGMSSSYMRDVVAAARQMQKERFGNDDIVFNSRIPQKKIEEYCHLDGKCREILQNAYEKFNMTARGYYKVVKVARTIADIEGKTDIESAHCLEALSYRNMF